MRHARAAAAFALLQLGFDLPAVVHADRVDLTTLRLSGDVALLVTLAWLVNTRLPVRLRRPARIVLALTTIALCFYQLDVAVSRVLMRHDPVLYDQVFLLKHLGFLLLDLWGAFCVLAALVLLVFVVLVARGVRRALRAIDEARAAAPSARVLQLTAAVWLALLLASAAFDGVVVWRLPSLAQSVAASFRLQQAIARGLRQSPYRDYARLPLPRKPRVLFFFIESYGRVLASDPQMRPVLADSLATLTRDLSLAQWHFASAYSEAPISGGRSWLAHASVLTGMRIDYQALFETVFGGGRVRVPSLIGFLRTHGYRTVLLGPADRGRPGLPVENPYGYDTCLGFSDLRYFGPKFGWGRVPDQYSLAYAHDTILATGGAPLFFLFTMVSSHAPWLEVPALVDDARSSGAYRQMQRALPASALAPNREPAHRGVILRTLERYSRELSLPDHRLSRPELRAAYARSVAYDFELIRRELLRLSGDDLVIIMGDHQPPLLTPEASDMAVPVHVLSRDPAWLTEFLAHGFSQGLLLSANAPPALRHEGLFSLLVRDLVRVGAPQAAPPPFLARGARAGE